MTLQQDSDAKSEATILLEALLERMEERFEAVSEALRIPMGIQEVTMDGARKWWKGADYEARRQFVKEHGVEATMRILGPSVLG